MLRSVEQQVELDQYDALLRQLAAAVIGLHQHAMCGALRLTATFLIGGVEVLVGHDHGSPRHVVLIIEGAERKVFEVPDFELNAEPLETAEHWPDTRDALAAAVRGLGDEHDR